ncbi:CRISPR-associated helicase Cas3', partial [candidate division KSB1 bacterium]|nr:CRISPR-associated helicase Cas3' [candidate division KSB1 bacterium]
TRNIQFSEQQHPVLEIARSTRKITFIPNQIDYWQNLILAGSTKICDHYGSAGIKKIELLEDNNFEFLNQLRNKLISEGKDFYQHQIQASQRHGNSILIAPTGSGKTEASLGWLNTQLQISQGRTYYILPYTASINAMHKRLLKDFAQNKDDMAANLIGIQHGKLMHYLASFYDEITDSENEKISKHEKIKQLYDQYQKIIQPLKITTPFQILKYCYGVKGFEMGFAGLAGAKLIFDEIHAYDTTTFAQILVSLKYFIQHLKCSVFIMTATLPTFMLNELKKALNVENIIKADNNLLESFTRHQVQIRDGSIFDQINEISSDYKSGKRVIVVCNTVQNAQAIYRDLLEQYSVKKSEMTLLHGRFNADDRNQKEMRVFQESNRILIGTQAIEVSLDIDYDVMYTEPAPLDALMQRFGRINRHKNKGIAPVYVCKRGGEHDFRIYPEVIVSRTLDALQQITVIRETELQDLLDKVYPNWEGKEAAEYSDTVQGFEEALKNLQPYADHKEEEEAFYEKFDGIQVLPAGLFGKYKQAIEAFNFIEADKLLVTIQRGMYFKLRNIGQIDSYPFEIMTPSGKAIKKSILIAKCHYSSELGMTNEFEEIKELQNLL